jgi:hypothetical protein
MKTPFGADCKFYYADFHRGRNTQECRLLHNQKWTPALCKNCPAPRIQLANACEHLTLTARIDNGFLGLNRHVVISAFCSKSVQNVKEPAIGCGQCHGAKLDFKLE